MTLPLLCADKGKVYFTTHPELDPINRPWHIFHDSDTRFYPFRYENGRCYECERPDRPQQYSVVDPKMTHFRSHNHQHLLFNFLLKNGLPFPQHVKSRPITPNDCNILGIPFGQRLEELEEHCCIDCCGQECYNDCCGGDGLFSDCCGGGGGGGNPYHQNTCDCCGPTACVEWTHPKNGQLTWCLFIIALIVIVGLLVVDFSSDLGAELKPIFLNLPLLVWVAFLVITYTVKMHNIAPWWFKLITIVAFCVELFAERAELFNTEGKPGTALILPNRFATSTSLPGSTTEEGGGTPFSLGGGAGAGGEEGIFSGAWILTHLLFGLLCGWMFPFVWYLSVIVLWEIIMAKAELDSIFTSENIASKAVDVIVMIFGWWFVIFLFTKCKEIPWTTVPTRFFRPRGVAYAPVRTTEMYGIPVTTPAVDVVHHHYPVGFNKNLEMKYPQLNGQYGQYIFPPVQSVPQSMYTTNFNNV